MEKYFLNTPLHWFQRHVENADIKEI